MIDSEAGSSHTSDVLRDLLGEIETLRITRREEARDRPHPRLKRFTQQELTDEACPTYKNLLVGRSRRVPSRQSIMQIAHYLECSAAERNTLLLAARYLPEHLELEGSQLKQALEQAHRLIGTLPYPAMLLTHTLEVQAVNDFFQRVFEFPPLHAIPPGQRDLFHFVFHPSKAFLSRHATTGELLPIQLRHMYISVCSHRYPCIAAFFPLDEAARAVFASLGSAEEPGSNAVSRHASRA
jgi:hypothetical protein